MWADLRCAALQCRRPILDPGYLACLHQPNIELRWGEIKEIQEDGILMEGDVGTCSISRIPNALISNMVQTSRPSM